MSSNKVCPVPGCGKEFCGQGWTGIDAHWRSKKLVHWRLRWVLHEDIESYEDAKEAGILSDRWQPPEERNEREAIP